MCVHNITTMGSSVRAELSFVYNSWCLRLILCTRVCTHLRSFLHDAGRARDPVADTHTCSGSMEKDVEMEARTIADDILEDLDVCKECTGTWKVACYGAWSPNSQFWEDFLEDGWEEGAYSPRACCLRLMCGLLFLFFAPIWCCKAIFFCLFWPCICCCRAARDGNCNREYFKIRRSKYSGNSQPLAYIESAHPSPPVSDPDSIFSTSSPSITVLWLDDVVWCCYISSVHEGPVVAHKKPHHPAILIVLEYSVGT